VFRGRRPGAFCNLDKSVVRIHSDLREARFSQPASHRRLLSEDDATMSRMTGHQHTDDAHGSTRRLTYRDFVHFPDDGRRHELIDGKHYVTPSPAIRHERLYVRLMKALMDYIEVHTVGELFGSRTDCVMSLFDVVVPDLLLITNDQTGIITRKNLRGAPALVIEINSPGTRRRDRRHKRDLYARAGVREYWMIDPDANTITVFRRTAEGEFPAAATLHAPTAASLTTPMLPGFELELPHYFRE
jgi:Uma2 family endonuclease